MKSKSPVRLLSPDQLRLEKGVPIKMDHLRRLWKRGKFPKPLQISDRKIAWLESEVDEWIAAREHSGEAA